MPVPKVGDIWFVDFPYKNLYNDIVDRTVLIIGKHKGSYFGAKITKQSGHKKTIYRVAIDKETYNLTYDSYIDMSDVRKIDIDTLRNYRSNIQIGSKLYIEVENAGLYALRDFISSPWNFMSWCVRNDIKDISDGEDHEVKTLSKIVDTKEATDVDIALITYEICENNKDIIPRYLILRYFKEDKEYYSMFCVFKYKKNNKIYALVMYNGSYDIVGKFDTFKKINVTIAKSLKSIMFKEPSSYSCDIYDSNRESRVDNVNKLVRKSKSSMTRGLVIDLLTEGEETESLNEIAKILEEGGEFEYRFRETLQTIDLI